MKPLPALWRSDRQFASGGLAVVVVTRAAYPLQAEAESTAFTALPPGATALYGFHTLQRNGIDKRLSISRTIIEQRGSRVRAVANDGAGLQFTV